MANPWFRFKQFTIHHDRCAMKVTTDACLFGAWIAQEVQQLNGENTLLDIGTGTGLLSLMVAQKNPCLIDAVEIEWQAASQAKENVHASPWKERIRIIQHDVLQWEAGKKYNVIISNPPFYERDLKSSGNEKNTAHHSTDLTLEQVMRFIKNNLFPKGKFFLLLPYSRLTECKKLADANDFYLQKIIPVKQTVDHSPFRIMVMGSWNSAGSIEEMELSVKDEKQNYTPGFTALLTDYYLYL